MRYVKKLPIVLVAVVAGFVGALVAMGLTGSEAQAQVTNAQGIIADHVQTKTLEIVDEEGRRAIMLTCPPEGPGIVIFDQEARPVAMMGCPADGPAIALSNPVTERVYWAVCREPGRTYMTMPAGEGANTAKIVVLDNGPAALSFHDGKDQIRAFAGIAPETGNGFFMLLGPSGKPQWSTSGTLPLLEQK